MNKIVAGLIVLGMAVMTLSCQRKCPPERTIYSMTPDYVEEAKQGYQADTLHFVSEEGEALTFVLDFHEEDKVVNELYETLPCYWDHNKMVDVYFEGEETSYRYVAEDGSSIEVRYGPSISSVINYYRYDDDWESRLIYRHQFRITLTSSETTIVTSRLAMWEDPEAREFFRRHYTEPLSFGGVQYEDVDYFSETPQGPPRILCINLYQLVGFIDDEMVRWIRL